MVKDFLRRARLKGQSMTGKAPVYKIALKCPRERHGSYYGGWMINPQNVTSDSIVYSFGAGEDVSFDVSLITRYGVTVHAFDPTPRSIAWVKAQNLPLSFRFYEYGIAGFDGSLEFSAPDNPQHVSYSCIARSENGQEKVTVPVYRLKTIMNQLGHDRIDILKMDIEGAEYAVIDDLVESNVEVGQLLVEFHHRFDDIGIDMTQGAVDKLSAHGYKLFFVSPTGEECSFIRQ